MRILWLLPAVLVLWPHLLAAASPERVASLRQEVDRLATELEDTRRQARDELSSLRAERAELERQVRLERVRAATLQELAREAQKAAEALDRDLREDLTPAREALSAARDYLRRALPFRLEERAAALDRVEADLTAGDVARGMNRLWRFVQEEDAMGGEVSLTQQSAELRGKRRLVDVARIGMALLFYRAADGTVAHAVWRDDEWRVQPIESPAAKATIHALFAALEDNRRFGFHELLLPGDVVHAQ